MQSWYLSGIIPMIFYQRVMHFQKGDKRDTTDLVVLWVLLLGTLISLVAFFLGWDCPFQEGFITTSKPFDIFVLARSYFFTPRECDFILAPTPACCQAQKIQTHYDPETMSEKPDNSLAFKGLFLNLYHFTC